MPLNVISLDRFKKEGRSLPRVCLTQDLKPERVLEFMEDGILYRKGWKGSVIEMEPKGNHTDCLPILFDDYLHPVWIPVKYLEQV